VATRTGAHEQIARAHRGLARAASDFEVARHHDGQAFAVTPSWGWHSASRRVIVQKA
jgi:hypothetical protein